MGEKIEVPKDALKSKNAYIRIFQLVRLGSGHWSNQKLCDNIKGVVKNPSLLREKIVELIEKGI